MSCIICEKEIDYVDEGFEYVDLNSCEHIFCNKCAQDIVDCYNARDRRKIKEHILKVNNQEG